MMSLNRYRLKHLVREKHRGAMRASRLLDRTDRLIGVILIGNNFVNIAASAIATVIAIEIWGEAGIAIATGLLTLVILIFAEVTPKTLAALHPEKVAFPASLLLLPLLWIFYPLVWTVNLITNLFMRLFGVRSDAGQTDHLSQEELRTVVHESGALIPQRRQGMLLNILDLDTMTVNDIMVPRNEVIGLDIDDDLSEIMELLRSTQHTRLPVFRGDIQQVIGLLHMRNAARLFQRNEITKEHVLEYVREPYFIPENTPLTKQLFQFQQNKRRIGLVVDEYGDVQGIVTLEDILEEIVGEFTTDFSAASKDIHPQEDGSVLIDASAQVREINRAMDWELPIDGAKTLNGLITDHLETIPETTVCMNIDGYYIEIVQVQDNLIRTVRMHSLRKPPK